MLQTVTSPNSFALEIRYAFFNVGGQAFLSIFAGEKKLLQFAFDTESFAKTNFRAGDDGAFDASDSAGGLVGRAELPGIREDIVPERLDRKSVV